MNTVLKYPLTSPSYWLFTIFINSIYWCYIFYILWFSFLKLVPLNLWDPEPKPILNWLKYKRKARGHPVVQTSTSQYYTWLFVSPHPQPSGRRWRMIFKIYMYMYYVETNFSHTCYVSFEQFPGVSSFPCYLKKKKKKKPPHFSGLLDHGLNLSIYITKAS